jgi:hypothetical protein
LGFEDEIIEYLYVHGNTKESDLIEFGSRSLHLSSKAAKEKLDKMAKEGWIGHIIHSKLKSPALYVTFKEPLLYDLEKAWTRSLNPQKVNKKALREEAQKILEEAAQVAEQRIKQKSSDSGKTT